jgi:alpha-galactosidase
MEGKGSMLHLEALLTNPLTKSTYQHYGTPGNYSKRDDVYIYFQDDIVYQGPLSVGYGSPYGENFGPELEFGWIVGDATAASETESSHNGDVLIIKCAWGGKSLAVDFRPPSSGTSNYTNCDDEHGCRPYAPSEYGVYYRKTVATVYSVLENLPNLDLNRSHSHYEIAGLVWFQGWNDLINDRMVAEYDTNLANWIRDMRADLETPDLPVVIGEPGQAGPNPPVDGLPHVMLRHQMRKVADQPEFVGTTRYVMTSVYVNSVGESFNGDYHYYGRADTEFLIGRAFGTAMLQLLEDYEPIVKNVTMELAHIELKYE